VSANVPTAGLPAGEPDFDFPAHRRLAIDAYQPVLALYEDFAEAIHAILKARLTTENIHVNATDHRGKSIESFGDKAQKPSEDDPNRPKYPDPMEDITDLAGVRIITNYLSTEPRVDAVIDAEFSVLEKSNKTEALFQEERFGYHSIHYLVKLGGNRQHLPEYERFSGLIAEIQVRTVLQHAWAEIEHDIQYKAPTALPLEIRRRFMTLAGLLEMADREFESIQEDGKRLQELARESVAVGEIEDVEITPDSLKTYLDRRLGGDDRIRESSYIYETRFLRRLGFTHLGQLDDALAPYDDDQVSRVVHTTRQGQLTRLEAVLLAALGNEYIRRHPASKANDWYTSVLERWLASITAAGIGTETYVPDLGSILGS
jgi:ppGpp synthetase/RelA/SpoT-type nucleotidyltranferase